LIGYGQDSLPPAREQGFQFILSQPELIRDAICDIRDALVPLGSKSENGEA
jgi:hypothetical protein